MSKRTRGLRGGPEHITTEERKTLERLRHRTSEQKRIVEDGADFQRALTESMRCQAATVGIDFTSRIAEVDEVPNAEDLHRFMVEQEAWIDATKAMVTYLEVIGGAPSLAHGEYNLPKIPQMTPETMRQFMREKLLEGERSCVAKSNCYVHELKGWPEDRELVAMTEKGLCALCHDNLVYKVCLDQTSKDARNRMQPDPNENQLTYFWGSSGSVNSVQYLFGPGGYKYDLVLLDKDLKPPTGTIGTVIVPSRGHFVPALVDNIWVLDDTTRHFP